MNANLSRRALPLLTVALLCTTGIHSTAYGGEDCPTDVIANGATDVDDLVEGIILNWGCEGDACIGDVPGVSPGIVDVDDLVAVILSWGPCPTSGPPNDACADAIAVELGVAVVGETLTANADGDAYDCGASVDSPGVWYKVTGDGTPFTATLCTEDADSDGTGDDTDYDSKIHVYAGPCGELGCVGGDDDGCGVTFGASALTWCSVVDREYLILVEGWDGAQGNFTLTVTAEVEPCEIPANDLCSEAIPVELGVPVDGETNTATIDGDAFDCGTSVDSPGVWYSFTGNGHPITASLCGDADYDTKIHVYEGPCDALVCVAGDDDGCGSTGGPSVIPFCSVAGREYLAFVEGWTGATGTFTLTVTAAAEPCEIPANDDCIDAIPINAGLTPFTTIAATSSDAPGHAECDPPNPVMTNDIWFTYTAECDGPMGFLTVSTCEDVGASADYDTDIVVYDASAGLEAACADLPAALIGCDDDGCPIGAPASPWHSHAEVPVINGQDVLIRVGGSISANDRGEGMLLIECVGGDNDDCQFATLVDLAGGSAETQLDNCGATVDNLAPICGSSAASQPGRWLTFYGTGSEVTIELCNANNPGIEMGTFIDTRLHVYCAPPQGLVCEGLKCAGDEPVDNAENCAGPATERVSLCSEKGRQYLVLVQGTVDGAGGCEGIVDVAFTVGAACADPPCPVFPYADSIADAIDVTAEINAGPVLGDNSYATPLQSDDDGIGDPELPDGSPSCQYEGTPTNAHNTVWYKFTAPGNGSITVTSCNTSASFNDSIMALYSGVPGALVELACSEDECGGPTWYGNFSVAGSLTPGETYYVMVANTGSYGGSTPGEFRIDITSP